ncbi:MAG: NAD(P)/FAD-dependent oxidoreductase [Candidatus Binatia bacterium]|nr:NAD(P)/FAD-dependent oxidoreductase [Candidatus Binatia bacterium]
MSASNGSDLPEYDAVVVGAGFAGLYMIHRLRGMGLLARVFETGHDVGGTWYWNRYPGARCDVESLEYSYQFSDELQQEWEWSERYATQPEILRYVNHVADRFDLRRDIEFETRVESAMFDEDTSRWHVETAGGHATARFVIMATGCLSSANTPKFEGLDTFGGDTFHTGRWPHEGVDFTGKRVGIIGTGSSAIQSIPHIAVEAKHLFVFQRTANYSVPAHNKKLDPEIVAAIKADYPNFRAENKLMPSGFGARTSRNMEQGALEVDAVEREAAYEARWEHGGLSFLGSFNDLLFSRSANDTGADFVRRKIRATVEDAKVAELLAPKSVLGCKRMCVDTGYYETYNRPNVTLVDVSEAPIEKITKTGLRVGAEGYELDCIVLATGFDAMTGALGKVEIRGRNGRSLADKWAEGPRTYLGLQTVGFPNLFTITGPGSPSVLTNMLPSIEQHVNFIADCIERMRETGVSMVEPTAEAEDAWVEHVNEVAGVTLLPTCNSWYLGANIPGKARVFMPYLGFPMYVEKCEEVVANDYEGFEFR